MSRIIPAMLLGMSLLAGCDGPKPPKTAHVPYPPIPVERRFPVTLGAMSNSLEAVYGRSTPAGDSDPVKIVKESDAKQLTQLVSAGDGKTDLSLSGPTYSDERFNWSDYRGRVVIVFFWASGHPTCREEFDNLEKVRKFYRYQPLEVVAVNLDRNSNEARRFLDTAQPSFPVIMDSEQDFEILRKYPTRTLPVLVCVNKTGQIVSANFTDPRLSQRMTQLIGEPYSGPMVEFEPAVSQTSAPRPSDTATRTSSPSANSTAASKPTSAGARTANRGPSTDEDLFGEADLVEAGVGAGKKGQGYGGDIFTEPLKARWRAEEKLIFDAQIPKAMSLYEATNGAKPKTHAEFMKEIIDANNISLPQLPAGQSFLYQPETGKLMIRQPKK